MKYYRTFVLSLISSTLSTVAFALSDVMSSDMFELLMKIGGK